VCLIKSVNRHAGHQLHFPEPLDIDIGKGDPDRIIWLTLLGVRPSTRARTSLPTALVSPTASTSQGIVPDANSSGLSGCVVQGCG
jgi:hypothetical protein